MNLNESGVRVNWLPSRRSAWASASRFAIGLAYTRGPRCSTAVCGRGADGATTATGGGGGGGAAAAAAGGGGGGAAAAADFPVVYIVVL